ncbi:class I adenylate-forming enzyme family protein [Candidatus Thiothrix sp. Deng01]|uniref:Class I adenylate-forming enzyme family protein n=1 Tax=Candidatus Thiothrix phosphatis TaxID=3112415 RepID=A0ABU6CWS4_9GAMM|nr:class I adenylate-forming enzyme family protein [Candidatus Thiothrix sp. Deng01]MEB4591253.1 class I adenylate-forming enzyme family protein [Candidatus Thiothrix sp. Deng01]
MTFAETITQNAGSPRIQHNPITDGASACTYAELPALLDQLGNLLQAQGVGSGDCVAVECANSLAGALTLLYLLQQGRSFMLLPPTGKQDQDLKPVPAFCQYRLVIAPPAARSMDKTIPQQLADALRVERLDSYDPAQDHADRSTARLYLRTSGSMGTAKIVVHTHDALLRNAQNCVAHYGYASDDRVCIPVPIFHFYGFGAAFLPAVLAGAAIDVQHGANLIKYLHREKHFHPNIAVLTPSLCEMLSHGFQQPRHYKLAVTSGQRIKAELFRSFDQSVGGCLVNQYGSSEMGATAACLPADPLETRALMVGRPMPGVVLQAAAEADGAAPQGVLRCQHPCGFEGYVDETGAWLHRTVPGGWYSTGDLVKTHPDGELEVLGRADNSLNRRGYLVLLTDIEKALEQIPAISQAIVVASEQENMQGQQLTAFCLPHPGSQPSTEQIRANCFEMLPPYARPDSIQLIDRYPMLPSGKIDRQALRARTLEPTP